jgi:hypothetical protein
MWATLSHTLAHTLLAPACLQHWLAAAHKWATRLVMMSHGAMGGWQPVEGHARVLWKWHVAGYTGVPYHYTLGGGPEVLCQVCARHILCVNT